MNIDDLSVQELKEFFKNRKVYSRGLIELLKRDKRHGVQRIARDLEQKIEQTKGAIAKSKAIAEFDQQYRELWQGQIGGLDEAGRGPLAGPLVSACVVLPNDFNLSGLNDSKALNQKQREELFCVIYRRAIDIGVGIASIAEIDNLNVLQATFLACRRALNQLDTTIKGVLFDGSQKISNLTYAQESIVKGDSKSQSIIAASIVAKVIRDWIMLSYDLDYPVYGFKKNKGYGSKEHLEAIKEYGPSPAHRLSFAPLNNLAQKGGNLFDVKNR